MNILITGSQGFLGKNLALKLKNKNFRIYGIGRGKWKKNEYKKWGYFKNLNNDIDLNNISKYKNISFKYIIHCAGKVIGLSAIDDFKTNVLTTQVVLDFIYQSKQKAKLIFISTLAVYGNGNKSKLLRENSKIKPISNYANNKILCEKMCIFYSKKYNFDLLIMRISSFFGPGLERQFIYDACKKIYNNNSKFHGTGEEIRDWLYIDDLTILISKILKRGFKKINIYNVGSGVGVAIKDVINFINKQFKKNLKPSFNFAGADSNPQILISSINKIKKFNWKPTVNFYIGLEKYINWFKKRFND
jgi:UDP-glucose 4-epimerase